MFSRFCNYEVSLLAHTLRRLCGGRRPESDPACLSFPDCVEPVVRTTVRMKKAHGAAKTTSGPALAR